MKLSYVFRRPRYPVLREVAGDILAARTRQQLERRLSRARRPVNGELRMVDASGEGWSVHLDLSVVSPLTLKKTWTKTELVRLYRESSTGQRNGFPYDERRVLRQRLDVVVGMLVDLLEKARSHAEREHRGIGQKRVRRDRAVDSAMDRALDKLSEPANHFLRAAARRVLKRSK